MQNLENLGTNMSFRYIQNFLEEFKTPQFPFEINWPLELGTLNFMYYNEIEGVISVYQAYCNYIEGNY